MKSNTKKYILASLAAAAMSLPAMSQNTRGGYFVDDYLYRFQMNPALGNSKSFVAIPAIGNLNVGMHGNLHLTDVFYNVNGKTTTFLNPGVSVEEALGNLSDKNRLGTDVKINVLSFGFKGFGGYNTISIGARVDANVMLPKSFFSLAKEGIANKEYNIKNLGANAIGYAEIALGHSHQLTSDIRIGATVKALVGAGYLRTKIDEANLTLNEDYWTVTTNAKMEASMKGLTYKMKRNSHTDHEYVNGIDIDSPGVGGFGAAVDLGAEYRTPIQGLTVSASVLDLGFISWDNNMLASTNGPRTVNTDRYTFNADDDAPNSFDNEMDRLRDDLSAIYELDNMGDQGGTTTPLHATINVGAQYEMPFYDKLNVGLLNTTRLAGEYTWTDFRLSANVAPVKVLSAGVNMGMGTLGMSFGWLLNLRLPGFNLFVGSDHTPGKLAKQGIPLSSNASVNFGMNVSF